MLNHPSRHALPTRRVQELIDTWGSRATALEHVDDADVAAFTYRTCIGELANAVMRSRREWRKGVEAYKRDLAKQENEARQSAYWCAGQARALEDVAEKLLARAMEVRETSPAEYSKLTGESRNAMWRARRAAQALKVICEMYGLEPEKFLADVKPL